MPQLDPSPWLLIFVTSWTILILFTPSKIATLQYLNLPSLKSYKTPKKTWPWPWH